LHDRGKSHAVEEPEGEDEEDAVGFDFLDPEVLDADVGDAESDHGLDET